MTKQDFLKTAGAAARASSAKSGLPAGIAVAQAALESAWGASKLSRVANNYFGIKALRGREWVEMPTLEEVGGRKVWTRARFVRFTGMEECFAERDAMILRLRCYAEACAAKGDPQAFTRALARHWATDSRYADKVLAIWRALPDEIKAESKESKA